MIKISEKTVITTDFTVSFQTFVSKFERPSSKHQYLELAGTSTEHRDIRGFEISEVAFQF